MIPGLAPFPQMMTIALALWLPPHVGSVCLAQVLIRPDRSCSTPYLAPPPQTMAALASVASWW